MYSLLVAELLLPGLDMLLGITPSCSSNKEALLHKRAASPNDSSADLATSRGPLITISLIELKPAFLSWFFKEPSISSSLSISNSSICFHLTEYNFSSKASASDFCGYSCFSILTLLLPSFQPLL